MKNKINYSFLIIILLVFSCKNQNKNNKLPHSDDKEIITEQKSVMKDTMTNLRKDEIIEKLQGEWIESEYPYRKVEFLNSTVKFVEEGTPKEPEFEKFEFSKNCQFDNNNIKNLKASDIVLNLLESKRCEKLSIEKDTLILYGYSTNTKENYQISYQRKK